MKKFSNQKLLSHWRGDYYSLDKNEYIDSISRVHLWVFATPIGILLIAFYLWIKSISRGYFTLEFLLYLPTDRPEVIPETAYHYMLLSMERLRELLPRAIYNFIVNTKFHPLKWLSQLIMLYGFYRLLIATITYFTTKITLTNHRVLISTGVFRPQSIDITLPHIASFHERKGLLGQFLNISTIIIQSTGGLITKVPAIKDARNIRRDILNLNKN